MITANTITSFGEISEDMFFYLTLHYTRSLQLKPKGLNHSE